MGAVLLSEFDSLLLKEGLYPNIGYMKYKYRVKRLRYKVGYVRYRVS